ncbi:DUF11 domain-containing protein [Limnohabitans sp. G3-2]|uniref:beta strand repeat-containing protein n=1 Tax=Limnohabitans sp. G3-2 TaxID=1100711 RepID=UPI000C1F155B|nr:DUF11 domain-containing protein [Limnohabitans sp. G3-2]PIT72143.1 hypothetical protein B9Z31_13565 [Limnohabitans sp. G3-2]
MHTWRQRGVVLLAWVGGLCASQLAFAAAPPAGTSITNQATASYKDNTGASQLSTSNTVVTTVSQVGSYTLTPASNAKSAGPGATVYMAYMLTNTGNGTDSFNIKAVESATTPDFTKIEIYPDNGGGLPQGTQALCTQATAGQDCVPAAQTLAAGQSYAFVVAYTIPSTATLGTWPSNTGTVTVTPSATLASLYSTATLSRTDTVTLTNSAAFSVTKQIGAPQVSPVNGTWPVATSGPRGTTTTYTIHYTNNGAAAGDLYIKDTLVAGLSYKSGQSVISCLGGNALTEAGDAAIACGAGSQTVAFEQSGQVIQALVKNVPVGSSGTLSFQVDVSNAATIGTLSNSAQYTASSCVIGTVTGCSAETLVNTNAVDFNVTANRSLRLNTVDTTAGTPAGATDGVTSANIVPGSFVRQTHTLVNTGNAPDTFNVTVNPGNFPAGSTFTWLNANLTPLLDNNSDGIIDTGLMAAGSTLSLILQVTAPSGTPVANGVNYSATVTATSINDVNVKDATFAKITDVIGGYVDLVNKPVTALAGDVGPGPGNSPAFTTTAKVAGSGYSEIPLTIRNYDGNANTYTLSVSSSSSFQGGLPAGWSVVFSATACSAPTALANATTGSVAAISGSTPGSLDIYACVSSPANAPTSTQPLFIKVAAGGVTSNGAPANDVLYDAVSVLAANAYSFSLTANGSASVARGQVVDYPHNLVNTGVSTCGAGTANNYIKVTATTSAPNWTVAIYKDVNNDGVVDANDTLITNGQLVTGGLTSSVTNPGATTHSVKFIVRVFAPGGANAGDTATVTVTVSDVDSTGNTVQNAPNGCGQQINTDTARVVTGALTVFKTQGTTAGACTSTFPSLVTASQTAKPGDCVYYEVVATNNSAAPVRDVSLNDAAPAQTTLVSSSPAPSCSATGLTSGTSITATPANNGVSCGTSGTNTLAPGGSITLKFAIQINN